MDERLTYGQLCRVIKDVNSDIRHDRKVSLTRTAGQVGLFTHGASVLRMRVCHVRARIAGRAHAETPPTQISRMRMSRLLIFLPRGATLSQLP